MWEASIKVQIEFHVFYWRKENKSPHFLDQELRQTDELCYITGKKDGTFESGILTKTARHKPWISNGMINHDSRSITVSKAKKLENTENDNRDKRENH